MKGYDERIDGPQPSWPYKIGLIALGALFGWVGVLVDWGIGHRKHRMECSAESIFHGIWGWAVGMVAWFALTAAGILAPSASILALVVVGWSGIAAAMAGVFAACIPVAASTNGWGIFLLVVALLFILLSSCWIYGMRYKMTDEETARKFHGDDWIKPGEKTLRYDSAITIDAAPETIWPYIRQAGQSKAGWYSFDWLERLFTFDIHNHYDIHSEWQDLRPGTFQWFHQAPLTIGEWVTEASNDGPWYFASHSDSRTDPSYKERGPLGEAALKLWFRYFCWTWNWEVVPVEGQPGRSRLMWRCDCTFAPFRRTLGSKYFVVFILGTASIVMGRNFMDTMKALCEGRLKYGERNR